MKHYEIYSRNYVWIFTHNALRQSSAYHLCIGEIMYIFQFWNGYRWEDKFSVDKIEMAERLLSEFIADGENVRIKPDSESLEERIIESTEYLNV